MAILDSCVAYWRLEEASGSRFDSVGANTLTDVNTVTQNTGKVGFAADFVRVNSESLSIASNASLQMGVDVDFTLSAWVWLATVGAAHTIMDKGSFAGEYRLDVTNGAQARFYIAGGANVSSGAMTATAWHLIFAWYDQANLNVQVDNGAITQVASAVDAPAGAAPFQLGTDPGAGAFMNGRIDEAAIWKRVLTVQERSDLWNAGAGFNPFSGGALASSTHVAIRIGL